MSITLCRTCTTLLHFLKHVLSQLEVTYIHRTMMQNKRNFWWEFLYMVSLLETVNGNNIWILEETGCCSCNSRLEPKKTNLELRETLEKENMQQLNIVAELLIHLSHSRQLTTRNFMLYDLLNNGNLTTLANKVLKTQYSVFPEDLFHTWVMSPLL